MSGIFVSIASYRDPQTVPTILDLFNKAKNPSEIRIGLCLQQEENELDLTPIKNLNVDIIEYNWRESQGTCWARNIIQKDLIAQEDYYLQLDSHHRFCDNWDAILIELFQEIKQKYEKPIIGGYCPGYNPTNINEELEQKPMRICSFADFTDLGDLMFVPRTIKDYQLLQNKGINYIKARFLSGHFIFAENAFCKDCPYDPNLYFRGEELSLSARAYTHGYNFFHPTKPIIWHEYLREKETKHWDDHTKNNGFLITSDHRSKAGKQRARQLLNMEKHNINFGKYGLGSKKSLHDYELYAGICFTTKQVHEQTYDINDQFIEPKVMKEHEWRDGLMKKINIQFDFPANYISNIITKETNSLALLFYNSKDMLCYRKDIKKPDLIKMNRDVITLQFSTNSTPSRVVLIPFGSKEHINQTHIRSLRVL